MIFSMRNVPAFLIIFFVVQGVFFVGMYPLWEGSDEPVHFAYVQHIAENKKVPTILDHISQEVWFSVQKSSNPGANVHHWNDSLLLWNFIIGETLH